ncbi:hypothetical protein [Rhizobium leguminosarum]|uniref:hypothetical protein n=1 Tax=Rhizobium leguminosarum TaxID=384 RepID=UPI002E0D4051|nr:hypothetical protein U8Q02_37665 [Rhizobium leguminosarum]
MTMLRDDALSAAVQKARELGHMVPDVDMIPIIASFLRVGGYSLVDSPAYEAAASGATLAEEKAALDLDGYRRLVGMRATIEAAVEDAYAAARMAPGDDGDHHWRQVYDLLFDRDGDRLARQVYFLLSQMEREFPDYYDPDTTYQEDAQAWISAFDGMLEELSEELGVAADDGLRP